MTTNGVRESAQQPLTIVHIAGPAKVGRHTTAGRTLANRSLLLFSSFVIIIETALLGFILLLRLSRSAQLVL